MKHTKLISLLLFHILFSACVFGQIKAAPAKLIIEKAIAEAAKSQKNVFVIFHASWCGWCHKMDNSMNDEKLKDFFTNNYVIVHLTVDESKDNKDLENPGQMIFGRNIMATSREFLIGLYLMEREIFLLIQERNL